MGAQTPSFSEQHKEQLLESEHHLLSPLLLQPPCSFPFLPCSAFRLLPCAHRAVSELASPGPLLSFRVSLAAPSPHQGPAGCGACPQETQGEASRAFPLRDGLASAASPHSREQPSLRSHGPVRGGRGLVTRHPACSCLLPRGRSCGAEAALLSLGAQCPSLGSSRVDEALWGCRLPPGGRSQSKGPRGCSQRRPGNVRECGIKLQYHHYINYYLLCAHRRHRVLRFNVSIRPYLYSSHQGQFQSSFKSPSS